jgi:hypothetical protein
MLLGRKLQCGVLDRLLADVRAGGSRALVACGEPGIGKTALLGYAADTAPDFEVARAEGAESEMELPFAALHQLCGRMLDHLDRLPAPQRDALGVAFGLRAGDPPDRFLVGLAVLGLLSEMAASRPLLCLIDDAQWLDQTSAQALAFVARRLDSESVAMLFGTRDPGPGRAPLPGSGPDPGPGSALSGLPQLVLEGLSEEDARALLASVLPGRLDDRVRDRIIAESGCNPLALLELPRGVSAMELAGGFGVTSLQPVASRIEQSFLRQIAPLPEATRQLLLLAAAEPTGDPALLSRAAGSWASAPRMPPPRPRPTGCSPWPAGSPSATRWSARPSTGQRRRPTAAGPTSPSLKPRIRLLIPTGGPGTGPRQRRSPTKASRPSWSDPPAGPRRAAAWPRPPPSWSARPR